MNISSNLVGLDTSIVLRLLVGEPASQFKRAVVRLDEFRAAGVQAAVSDLVIAEAYFALQYHYDVPKQVALDTLKQFLESSEIVPLGVALRILQQPNMAKAEPGFVDRIIHAEYERKTQAMLTFEKAATRLANVEIPK